MIERLTTAIRRMRKSDMLHYIQCNPRCTVEHAAWAGADDETAGASLIEELHRDGWLQLNIAPTGHTLLSARDTPADTPGPGPTANASHGPPESPVAAHLDALVREAADQHVDTAEHVMHVVAGNMGSGSMSAGYATRLLMATLDHLQMSR